MHRVGVTEAHTRRLLKYVRQKYYDERDLVKRSEWAVVYVYALYRTRSEAVTVEECGRLLSVLRVLGDEYARPISEWVKEGQEGHKIAHRSYCIAAGLLWQMRGKVLSKYEKHRCLSVVDRLITWGLPHAQRPALQMCFKELWAEWSVVLGDIERAKKIVSSLSHGNAT